MPLLYSPAISKLCMYQVSRSNNFRASNLAIKNIKLLTFCKYISTFVYMGARSKYVLKFSFLFRKAHIMSEESPKITFQWVTEGLLLFLISFIGLIGNFWLVVKSSRQRVQRVFHRLLLALATFDTVSFL